MKTVKLTNIPANISKHLNGGDIIKVGQITDVVLFGKKSLDKIYTPDGKFIGGCLLCNESDFEVIEE